MKYLYTLFTLCFFSLVSYDRKLDLAFRQLVIATDLIDAKLDLHNFSELLKIENGPMLKCCGCGCCHEHLFELKQIVRALSCELAQLSSGYEADSDFSNESE